MHITEKVYHRDRFSADDAIGMVDVDLADLLERGNHRPRKDRLMEEVTELEPTRSKMKAQGRLFWSHAFYPTWKMSKEDLEKRKKIDYNKDEGDLPHVQGSTWGPFLQSFLGGLRPDPPAWEEERRKRRKHHVAWLSGEIAREQLEAATRPTLERRSGILQFTIAQGINIEVQRNKGTFSGISEHAHSGAAGGKPALEELVDTKAWESEKPPSPYAEVILNGRLIYRTRAKQMNPSPYWNAKGERFIRDWTKGKLVIVVRDERDRENGE